MKLRIQRLNKDLDLPSYAYSHDAGLDLKSIENYKLEPKEIKAFSTGIKIAIPESYAGFIWDRSGLAIKYGIHVLAGVIDAGYRGEVKVVLINLGMEAFTVMKYMKIAQLVIQPCITILDVEVIETDLDKTIRGEQGFGSSDIKVRKSLKSL